jgi:hypothetical protein
MNFMIFIKNISEKRMKFILFLAFSVLLSATSMFSQAKIEIVGGNSFDFGEIYLGGKVEKKLAIKNIGKDTLVIGQVQPSCGCTAALMSENKIAPNKIATLNIGFDSKGFNGTVHKSISITSNDTTNKTLNVTFTATIITVLSMDPQFIYFQNTKLDSTSTLKIKLTNNMQETVEIKSFEHKIQGLKLEIMQRKLMPKESTEISVSYIPTSEGMAQADVIINTSSKKQPKIPLRFFAFTAKK